MTESVIEKHYAFYWELIMCEYNRFMEYIHKISLYAKYKCVFSLSFYLEIENLSSYSEPLFDRLMNYNVKQYIIYKNAFKKESAYAAKGIERMGQLIVTEFVSKIYELCSSLKNITDFLYEIKKYMDLYSRIMKFLSSIHKILRETIIKYGHLITIKYY